MFEININQAKTPINRVTKPFVLLVLASFKGSCIVPVCHNVKSKLMLESDITHKICTTLALNLSNANKGISMGGCLVSSLFQGPEYWAVT